jgi:hypothetical protein
MIAAVLAILIIGGGYFVLKYLMLNYMARGGHFYYSGSDVNFSTDGQSVSSATSSCDGMTAGADAACGDGGGSGGGE